MTNEQNNTTEMNENELRDRLHELKDQHEAIEREMEQIQAQMDGEEAEQAQPYDPSDELRAEVEEWKGKYQRALADYQNYQHRAARNEEEARKQGVKRVCESLLPVLDNFDLALQGDPSTLTVESVLKGIVVTRDELLHALAQHGVTIVEPDPGDEFSPTHHEAVMQQDHEEVEPGAVVASLQKGYAMGDRTLRPAKVSVRPELDSGHSQPQQSDSDDAGEESDTDADV
jgi:molecular chaperone GrpE